jgi:hypothetical protein
MTLLDLAEGVLRVFGVLYVAGGVFMLNKLRMDLALDRALTEIERMSAAFEGKPQRPAEDTGRTWWLIAGAALTLAAGVAMALGLRLSVPLLALLLLQQILYFVRQRGRERAATTPEDAAEARPTQATRNGFYSCCAHTILAAWLDWRGALAALG